MELNLVKSTDYSFRKFLAYFLKLGAVGFGGPVALVSHMQNDLVIEKNWITQDEYTEGLALAQLAPGPLAAQLAIYLGWVRGGTLGATIVGAAFILPSFLIVLILSEMYLRFNGLPAMQALFYGIGAAVIAVISQSAWKLSKKTLTKDRLLWGIAFLTTVTTAVTESEIVWVFLLAGVLYMMIKAPFKGNGKLASFIPAWLTIGLNGPASNSTLLKILIYFTKAGAMVFGSGLAIVPFLHGGVVDQFHWLTEKQFIDAVAVAMITPGPVVITVAFIGYLTAGFMGATTAAIGVFLPCYLFVIIPAPHYSKIVKFHRIRLFVNGVTAAAVGAIAGAVFVLGRRAIHDKPTALIAIATLFCLLKIKKIPEPVVVLLAGIAGIIFYGRI